VVVSTYVDVLSIYGLYATRNLSLVLKSYCHLTCPNMSIIYSGLSLW